MPVLVILNVALLPEPPYPDCVGLVYVTALEPTEVTVTVALFAVVAPPKFAPTTVTVSLTLKPVPAAFIAAV